MKTLRIGYAVALVCVVPAFAAAKKSEPPQPSKQEQQADLATQLAAEKKKLAELLTKYTDKHPVVNEQRRRIADLEERLEKAKREKA